MPGLKLPFPHILGGDASGTVERVGKNVTSVKVGDEVIVHPGLSCGHCEKCKKDWESLCSQYQILGEHLSGTHAEFVKVPEANLFQKPKALSFEAAASIGLVFTTAWQMLVRRAQVQAGHLVLVHAAGSGVSAAGIQIAKLFGAKVIATSSSDEKLKKAQELGAEHLINVKKEDFYESVKKISKPGVDIVFDHVGESFWEKNIKLTKSGGVLVTCGATSGFEGKTDLRHVFYRQISLLGSTMGSKKDFPTILSHCEKGNLKASVDKIFPLSEGKEAQKYLEAGNQFGKVLLKTTA